MHGHTLYLTLLLRPAGNESERVLVLCILYHISIMDKCKPMFSLTDCMSTVRVCEGDGRNGSVRKGEMGKRIGLEGLQ